MLIGLYFIFGRFIYKNINKQHTYYAVINQRVLILNNLFKRSLKAQFIRHLPCINKSVRSNGGGTITFGNSSPFTGMYGNSGMEFFGSYYGNNVLIFYDILNNSKL